MKKIKYLLLLVIFAIVTTGCVKFKVNMDIKKDKSMEFSVIYAFDKSLMGEENSLKEENFKSAKEQGFEVVKYSEGNYEGFKLIKKVANIDEVSTEDDVIYNMSDLSGESSENKYIFKVVKGEEKNTYTAKIKFNADSSGMNTDDEDDENDEAVDYDSLGDEGLTTTGEDDVDTTGIGNSDIDLSGMMSNLDLTFDVKLPYSALSSNATTKDNDNKNLSWKLGYTGEQYIEFSFELKNNDSDCGWLLYAGIGAAVLLVVIVVVVIMSKKKNQPVYAANPSVPNMPEAPKEQ